MDNIEDMAFGLYATEEIKKEECLEYLIGLDDHEFQRAAKAVYDESNLRYDGYTFSRYDSKDLIAKARRLRA